MDKKFVACLNKISVFNGVRCGCVCSIQINYIKSTMICNGITPSSRDPTTSNSMNLDIKL